MKIFEITIIGLAAVAFGYYKLQEIGTSYRHII